MTDALDLARIDHSSGYGAWTLLRRAPPPALRPYVIEMQGYAERDGMPVVRKELPSGIVPMIVNFGPGFTIHDYDAPGIRALDRSFVAGLTDRHAVVGSQGEALCMQVDFTPLGARRFLGIELGALAGGVHDLNTLIGAAADRLEERLAEAADWPARFAILERVLIERLSRHGAGHRLVAAAWAEIERRRGDVRIGDLAASLDCSRKHLATLFRTEIGLPPKLLARVLRFERAIDAMKAGRFGSLADLALDCGYGDQAHFNHDFAKFAGEPPSQLMARILPDQTGVMAYPR
jgi:AraC-like DNA-binding protein